MAWSNAFESLSARSGSYVRNVETRRFESVHLRRPFNSPTLIDCVILHELAHVHEPNHTPAFWLLMERALSTFRTAKFDLARVEGRLWRGDLSGHDPEQGEHW